MKPITTLSAAIPAVAIAATGFVGTFIAGAGPVSAAPGPTPNGLTGAANMVNADAVPGMMNAMSVNVNGNGDQGMWCAVYITNGVTPPGPCR